MWLNPIDFKKREYGRAGKLSTGQWKHLLHSNTGLFAQGNPQVRMPGPTLNERTGMIIGDGMAVEKMGFSQVATAEQESFYEELESINPIAAKEYLLAVIKALDRWKDDVRWLQIALAYLKKEEQFLLEEQELIQHEKKRIHKKIPEVMKRHFPILFKDIEFGGLSFEQILAKIKTTLEEHIIPAEKRLADYLIYLRAEMPFLFERY